MAAKAKCDAVLMIGFGGPTRADEVRPFLDNVLRGRPIPRERYEEVVHHYDLLGGRSPYNDLTMRQAAALREELAKRDASVPVAVGMRNWKPYIADSMRALADAGARRVLGFIMAAHRSEASFERYQATVDDARAAMGEAAPEVVYPEPWHDHPLFIAAVASRAREAFARFDPPEQSRARLIFTAHSIPLAMAKAGPYVEQLAQSARMVAAELGIRHVAIRVSKPQRQSARRVARTRYKGDAAEPRCAGRRWSCRSDFCAITSRCCTISISKRRKSRARRESGWNARRPSATIRCSSR